MLSNTWKIYLLALISFLVGTSEYVIAGILDKIAEDIGVSVSAAGQLITFFSLTYALGTPILMAMTGRIERRKLLMYAMVVFVLGNLLAIALPGFGYFIAARIIMALGAGVVVVTSLTLATKMAPPGKQASALATVVTGFTAALIIGIPIGRMVAASYNWKSVFGGIGVLGLLAIIIIAFAIPRYDGESSVPLREQLALLKTPKIAAALGVTFLWIAGYSIPYTYISPYLLQVTSMSENTLSIALFGFGVASLIGSKLGGYSTDKWGVKRTLMGGMLVHAAALLLISFSASSSAIVFLLLMLWSFAAWSSGPTQQYNLLTLAPGASSIMLSLNTSVLQLAMAVGASAGGLIVAKVSLPSITWIGAFGVLLAVILIVLSRRLSGNREQVSVPDVAPQA
ncbi:MFS transporter, DHA1 family, purine base/nucleoside efflux pump [Paenibacillus algorifonticola]|uniref:MFS transporter, DHA1 family, purine base/nucleoside efflux pump n=1 Tax=Paenibacillus algorifonticola TaxID=684063 RepID=A0A1I2DQS5_9BACL|nr:MFS transporter, DHA1 family, purine base/nucleoside efflux pump [Paenibacillus algorifonticola]